MDAMRIDIRAYTASFRVPGMMGYQVTSPVPPPATIYGLLAAANGREVDPCETWVAYRFEYTALARDLEKIIIYGKSGPQWDNLLGAPKTNVLTREFIFEPHLILYVQPGRAAEAFHRPRYPLLLGRSQDVAYVEQMGEAILDPMDEADVAGILVPFPAQDIPSRIYNFPTFYPVGPERRPWAVHPFHVLDPAHGRVTARLPGLFYRDPDDSSELAVPCFTRERLSS